MASVETPTELKVEHLLRGVKKLSPFELDEFTQKFVEWQQQQENSVSEKVNPNASDEDVLAFIRKNSELPEKENRRYWQLRRKSDNETLTDDELPEYQELITKLDVMNVKRLEALAILVQRWEKPVREIMSELGLVISHFDDEPKFAEESTEEDYSESSRMGQRKSEKNNAS